MAETRTCGGAGNIDSVSFRQLPRKSVDIRGICGRKTVDGSGEFFRKTQKIWHKWQKLGRCGQNTDSVGLRQLARTMEDG